MLEVHSLLLSVLTSFPVLSLFSPTAYNVIVEEEFTDILFGLTKPNSPEAERAENVPNSGFS